MVTRNEGSPHGIRTPDHSLKSDAVQEKRPSGASERFRAPVVTDGSGERRANR